MDMFVKNRAMGKQYMNEKVGSELVEMHEKHISRIENNKYIPTVDNLFKILSVSICFKQCNKNWLHLILNFGIARTE